jgi:hypothetical protein
MAPLPDPAILSGLGASFGTSPWKGIGWMPPYYQYCLPFQLTVRPVVFFDSNQVLWQRPQDSIPANRETSRVLRPLWTKFPAETIRLHQVSACSDTLLVPANEPGNAARGRGGQWSSGGISASSLCHGPQCAFRISCLVVVGPKCRSLRLGHFRRRVVSLGLLRLERGPAQDQRLVYAQASDTFARCRCRSHDSLVDSGRPTTGSIPFDDWQISRLACDSCLGSRTCCFRTSLHRRGIARLSSGTRKNSQRRQYRNVVACADDDGSRMVVDLLSGYAPQTPTHRK